ncbi:hypothetical protein [Adhaeribacter aerolatus]|uniref:hypothetical protein n=1 Tax=Adhaeribacter aerolatus TaxID=670289 RepID=UPI0011BE76FB|nr:hypothetical protein [Adhaeribacter aerolatus]
MSTPDYKLLALFALIAAVIVLRVKIESTGYRSPDSWYYLECAQNILDGNGFYHSNEYPIPEIKTLENQIYFAVWPVGYPLLIAGFSFLFSLPVFWASKLVNIFFIGLCCLLFRKMNREYAYLLSLGLCSFTFLEIFSYTWSEAPFVFGLLWFGYALFHYLRDGNNVYLLQLFVSALFLFLIRYIGGFSFLILGCLSLWFLLQRKVNPAFKLLFITALLGIIAGLYFYNNYLQTGFLTGGERLYPDRESIGLFTWFLIVGLFNEFFIIRNYYWRGGVPDALFLVTACFQVLLMAFIYFKYLKGEKISYLPENSLSRLYFVIGFSYLLIIIVVRAFSPFDPFDYRILAPFSICIFTAIILGLVHPDNSNKSKGSFKYISLLFSVSLVLNLPKEFLIETFKGLVISFLK